ncbi:MAG TPA: PHB depolymerase family esterase [Rhodanobacteraceae bacterium]|nr:PHB depolymerase family esterase [Rhodanobacteraceae bacterium]
MQTTILDVRMFNLKFLAALAAASVAVHAAAATSVTLPGWVCAHHDAMFVSGFENDGFIPHDPSGGKGGAYPGRQARTLHIAGLGSGTQNYYVFLPIDYTPSRSWPMIMVLHGVAPVDDSYAIATRDNWTTVANTGHFIVAAPVATRITQCWNGSQYVPCETWKAPPTSGPSDYDLFAAVRADMESAYNIERTRIYGWGFSAGANVMHDLAINSYSAAFNASTMAAYGVSSGTLQGLACPGQTDAGCAPLLAALPRRIPVDIHIGTQDVDPSVGDFNYPDAVTDHNLFVSEGWVDNQTIDYTEFDLGHTYTIPQLGAIWNNICPNAVTP